MYVSKNNTTVVSSSRNEELPNYLIVRLLIYKTSNKFHYIIKPKVFLRSLIGAWVIRQSILIS